jgi:hypothetical protein
MAGVPIAYFPTYRYRIYAVIAQFIRKIIILDRTVHLARDPFPGFKTMLALPRTRSFIVTELTINSDVDIGEMLDGGERQY